MTAAAIVAVASSAPAAAQTPDRQQLERIVAERHDAAVQALRDWIALPTIAAETKNAAEGEYMRRLTLDAGFSVDYLFTVAELDRR